MSKRRFLEDAIREYLERRGIEVHEPTNEELPTNTIYLTLKNDEAELLTLLANKLHRRRRELVKEGLYLLFQRVKEDIERKRGGRLGRVGQG